MPSSKFCKNEHTTVGTEKTKEIDRRIDKQDPTLLASRELYKMSLRCHLLKAKKSPDGRVVTFARKIPSAEIIGSEVSEEIAQNRRCLEQ